MKNDSIKKRIYFDWASSAPLLKLSESSFFGNPSSNHSEGRAAKNSLEDARKRAAASLNVPPETLFFTSGGTESNSIALFSNLRKPQTSGAWKGRVISSPAEHASIREAMDTLNKIGMPIGSVPVDGTGRVTADLLSKTLNQYSDVRFAAIMSVNNETGAVTDINSLVLVFRSQKAPVHFHCDIVQAVGKIPVDITSWDVDSASISAHKIGGPRGIGLLYLKKPIDVFYSGGGQERGVRGGTENTQGAAALADCLAGMNNEQCGMRNEELGIRNVECGIRNVREEFLKAKARMNKLITGLMAFNRCTLIPRERVVDDDRFSPYILQVAFNDIPGEVMARALDDLGFAVSTGSACSSSSPERPVLFAMGVEEKLRIEGIRISQGFKTTDEDIDALLDGIAEVLKFL